MQKSKSKSKIRKRNWIEKKKTSCDSRGSTGRVGAYLNRSSMRHLQLVFLLHELVWHMHRDVPWKRSWAIHWSIYRLTSKWLVRPGSRAAFSECLESVLHRKHTFIIHVVKLKTEKQTFWYKCDFHNQLLRAISYIDWYWLVKIGFPFTGHDFFIHKTMNRIVYQ